MQRHHAIFHPRKKQDMTKMQEDQKCKPDFSKKEKSIFFIMIHAQIIVCHCSKWPRSFRLPWERNSTAAISPTIFSRVRDPGTSQLEDHLQQCLPSLGCGAGAWVILLSSQPHMCTLAFGWSGLGPVNMHPNLPTGSDIWSNSKGIFFFLVWLQAWKWKLPNPNCGAGGVHKNPDFLK